MVYIRSRLDVADNTGARMATMIGVIGKATARVRGIGDVITAHVTRSVRRRHGEKRRSGPRRCRAHQAADPAR